MIYRLAKHLEAFWLRAFPGGNRFPPLFIVGVPRSGTTVVYQHLVNNRRFAFFSNLAKAYPRSPLMASLWTLAVHRFRRSYESRFGIIPGASSPSDGWEIFHRWFPERDLSQETAWDKLPELPAIVRGLERLYRAPFINKNNSNSIRIPALSSIFPDSLYVHVRREMLANVSSLLRARQAHGIPLGSWWGALPPRFWRHPFHDEIEQAVFQVCDVAHEIETTLAQLPSRRWLALDYESFCTDPGGILVWVDGAMRRQGVKLKARRGGGAAAIHLSEGGPGDGPFRRRVEESVARWRSLVTHG
ncbi:MAG: sulfotransferase [Candidatus Aminicenantes bacterium]|nr:sulfotransferase [Candidatus Aminicenantes bacterium]